VAGQEAPPARGAQRVAQSVESGCGRAFAGVVCSVGEGVCGQASANMQHGLLIQRVAAIP